MTLSTFNVRRITIPVIHLIAFYDAMAYTTHTVTIGFCQPSILTKLCVIGRNNHGYFRSSRRPQEDSYYYDDDFAYDDANEKYDTRYVGGSKEERDLKYMASGYDDYYDLEDDDGKRGQYKKKDRQLPRRNNENDYDVVDEWDEDQYESGDDSLAGGNFWSNPKSSVDPIVPPTRSQAPPTRSARQRPPFTAEPQERYPRPRKR